LLLLEWNIHVLVAHVKVRRLVVSANCANIGVSACIAHSMQGVDQRQAEFERSPNRDVPKHNQGLRLEISHRSVSGTWPERSDLSPDASTSPAATASAQLTSPVTKPSHTSGLTSTTAGGVPRRWVGPATHWV